MAADFDRFVSRYPNALSEDDQTSPRVIRIVGKVATPLAYYHRFRCLHRERIPSGACLIVANHSVGAIEEFMLILRAWYEDPERQPLRALAHRFVWQRPWSLLPLTQRAGGILAHRETALRALRRGYALLVFPGGEREVARPYSQRYQITLGDRTGFVSLAREAKVPIVPLVICGSHGSYIVLPGASRLAGWTRMTKLFGVKALPMTLGGVGVVAAILGTLGNPLLWPLFWPILGFWAAQALIPLPTKIEAEFLDPIVVNDEESDEEVAERVRRAMQQAMETIAERIRPRRMGERLLKRILQR